MGHRLDRVMYYISILYIALPVFVFLAGWLRLAVAVPVCILFLISVFFTMKNRPEQIKWHISKKQWGIVIASLIILAVWVFFSGQGGFSFQNGDYHYRNAIFRDLIDKSWPVLYNHSSQSAASASIVGSTNLVVLTYYIAFWLPGALVGKLFGWYAANAFLYFWTFAGLTLIVYYLFRLLKNIRIWTVLILVFFSGLDGLGYILLSHGKIPGLIDHIEWWSGLQYSSNTTLLFWVFNQTITIWLAVLLIMQLKNSRSLFFIYAMLLLHGPFPFLGMLPIVLWKAYQGHPLLVRQRSEGFVRGIGTCIQWVFKGVYRALTFENICGGISVLSIIYLYLSNNVSGSKYAVNELTPNYYVFFVLECGLYLLFLYASHGKNPLYWICLFSLIAIPFFRVGTSQDFCMRVSIPALFLTQIMIQQTLLGRKTDETAGEPDTAEADTTADTTADAKADTTPDTEADTEADTEVASSSKRRVLTENEQRFIRIILIVLLVMGMVVPIEEISRSVAYTLPAYPVTKSAMISVGNFLQSSDNGLLSGAGSSLLSQSDKAITWSDSIKTLDNQAASIDNFVGPVKGNLFYEYLARKN